MSMGPMALDTSAREAKPMAMAMASPAMAPMAKATLCHTARSHSLLGQVVSPLTSLLTPVVRPISRDLQLMRPGTAEVPMTSSTVQCLNARMFTEMKATTSVPDPSVRSLSLHFRRRPQA